METKLPKLQSQGLPQLTDLSKTKWLSQKQIEQLKGDSFTEIPWRLTRPPHWKEYSPTPEIGLSSDGVENVIIDLGRITLTPSSLPDRSDLHTLFDDLTEEVEEIARAGNFNNISVLLDSAFIRFRRICQTGFNELDQVRFGVQIDKLDTQFQANRTELDEFAPDRNGALEAMLVGARLIAARLPKYRAFLVEQAPNEGAAEAHFAEVGAALEQVAEGLAQDPEHFEPGLVARVKEYWETGSIKAYLAGAALLNNVAHVVFSGVRRVVRGVSSEGEKLLYKGIAAAIIAAAGSQLAVLAGILPAELGWIGPWLEFLKAFKL